MDAPAPVHLKEMYKGIMHVLSTKGYGLKFELRKDIIKWALKALSDSDFASDKGTRISVFGYIIYFCGIPIAWRSKGMKSVELSTTEAEYMALSEVVKELKFIVQLLQTMNIEVELPITVHVDNVGAIWFDRIPSTTPGAEPPRDARDSGSARSHSTHLETSSSIDLKWSPTRSLRRYQAICPLRARDGRYVCQISRAQRTHSRP